MQKIIVDFEIQISSNTALTNNAGMVQKTSLNKN